MTWFVLVFPLALLLLGFPIFVILIAASACLLMFFMNVPYAVAHQTLFGAIDKFSLLAVPFCVAAASLLPYAGHLQEARNWSPVAKNPSGTNALLPAFLDAIRSPTLHLVCKSPGIADGIR